MYPPSFAEELPIEEMGVRVGVGRTHLYYKGTPEFPFGHGLSYSAWTLQWADSTEEESVSLELSSNAPTLRLKMLVKNEGPRRGRQTVLLFWKPNFLTGMQQKLIGFQGTKDLDIGEEEGLEFELHIDDLKIWDDSKKEMTIPTGKHHILEARASNTVLQKTLHLVDNNNNPEPTFRHFTATSVAAVLRYFQSIY
eukprot:CAMPEP_0178896880 /NCGR_PEP_ID=MMETSP0786-20121207/1430_1 /TAXON_ID=186022 /ORGANISM="Thalassionema frauenfeldii, Strain CCMP 1798" /LENGTH=194 /DNA_ID=CAMNT_0020567355 /DNA_START=501 /DNA_END=1085 /DNA_ORIENTATION=-